MASKRCWDCSNTFYSNTGGLYCNVCYQARETRKRNDRQAQQDRWAAEQAQRENARIQAQHTQALINAENQRINAINRQTQAIMESSIRPKDAYDRGFKYVDSEFKYGNPAELELEIDEAGTLGWQWNYLYVTTELNSQFRNGLSAKLNQNKNIYSTIKDSAKRIGKGNADGSFPSTYFTLYTGLSIGGVDIKTKGFKSHFTSTIDEDTGELKMNWNEPFTSSDLNQAYKDGVNEVYWSENTDEKKSHRLEFDVPEIKNRRKHVRNLRFLDKLFRLSVYTLPVLFFLLMWQVTTGWSTFFMFIASCFMPKFIRNRHYKWWDNNSEFLR
jgi:uncharacterized Zn finger protein (UPF0148 family)